MNIQYLNATKKINNIEFENAANIAALFEKHRLETEDKNLVFAKIIISMKINSKSGNYITSTNNI